MRANLSMGEHMNTNQNRRPTHSTVRARLHLRSPTDKTEPTIGAGPASKFSHPPVPLLLVPVLLGLSIIACSAILPSPSPTATEAVQPTARPPTATVSINPSETSPAVAQQDLNPAGPWWVFSSQEGLFAVNPDGSGLTELYPDQIPAPYTMRIRVAPSGSHLAFITGPNLREPTMRVITLPDPEYAVELPLTTAETRPGSGEGAGDMSVEAVRAITEQSSLAFSPDGLSLAFVGAIDGPTSDLYLLSMEDNEITRLSDGPSHAYQPVWSPDGQFIVHTGARTFGTGAGYTMEGVWAARADDTGVLSLYDPSDSNAEEIVGWTDDETFLVHSWNPDCGPNNLRTFSVESQRTNELWPGYFQHIAFDPVNARAAIGKTFEDCKPEGQSGLFHVPTDGSGALEVVEDQPDSMIWSPNAELIFASTAHGVLAVDSLGQFIDLDVPQGAQGFPAAAPGSRDLAWSGSGLWVGKLLGSIDNPPMQIYDRPVDSVSWDLNGEALFFFAERGLYMAQLPDFTPNLVAEGLDNRGDFQAWVIP